MVDPAASLAACDKLVELLPKAKAVAA